MLVLVKVDIGSRYDHVELFPIEFGTLDTPSHDVSLELAILLDLVLLFLQDL